MATEETEVTEGTEEVMFRGQHLRTLIDMYQVRMEEVQVAEEREADDQVKDEKDEQKPLNLGVVQGRKRQPKSWTPRWRTIGKVKMQQETPRLLLQRLNNLQQLLPELISPLTIST